LLGLVFGILWPSVERSVAGGKLARFSLGGMPPAAGLVFLDIDNGLSLSKASEKAGVLFAEGVVLSLKQVGLGACDLGGQGSESAFGAELTPFGALGGVDAFTAKEGATFGRAGRIGVVLFDQAKALSGGANRPPGGGLDLGAACGLRGTAVSRLTD
jgi:hypothetical protein